ncbi:MAG: hypothetical protein ABFD54_11355 [Armatimonadota bacterium]
MTNQDAKALDLIQQAAQLLKSEQAESGKANRTRDCALTKLKEAEMWLKQG